MISHEEINEIALKKQIKQHRICFGGNMLLKIYGTLHCKSGKRMKKQNRIFFVDEIEAVQNGYRPCGNCLKEKNKTWKNNGFIQQ